MSIKANLNFFAKSWSIDVIYVLMFLVTNGNKCIHVIYVGFMDFLNYAYIKFFMIYMDQCSPHKYIFNAYHSSITHTRTHPHTHTPT